MYQHIYESHYGEGRSIYGQAAWPSPHPRQRFNYDGLGSVRQMLSDAGSPLLSQTFDLYDNLYAKMN